MMIQLNIDLTDWRMKSSGMFWSDGNFCYECFANSLMLFRKQRHWFQFRGAWLFKIILPRQKYTCLSPGDLGLADRGFLIQHDELSSRGVGPHQRKTSLSARDDENRRKLSYIRIHVERAMKRLKNFIIFSGKMPEIMAISAMNPATTFKGKCYTKNRIHFIIPWLNEQYPVSNSSLHLVVATYVFEWTKLNILIQIQQTCNFLSCIQNGYTSRTCMIGVYGDH